MGEVSRFDDALWHRKSIRTPGGDAAPENAANPSGTARLLGFAAFSTSLQLTGLGRFALSTRHSSLPPSPQLLSGAKINDSDRVFLGNMIAAHWIARHALVVVAALAHLTGAAAAGVPPTYLTTFSAIENPISESGAWSSIDITRTRMATSGGRCFGTQIGGAFDDSVALLTGIWPASVQITGTVFRGSTSGIEELEILFRGANTSTTTTGYEINYAHDGQYVNVYRWEGGINLADFVPLIPENTHSIPGGLSTGNQIRAQIQGDTITALYNKGAGWVTVFSASDTSVGGHAKYASGRPGIGAFKTSGSGALNQFEFEDLQVLSCADSNLNCAFAGDLVFANGFE